MSMQRNVMLVLGALVLSACALDSGGDANVDAGGGTFACADNSDCVVATVSCCGACGAAVPGDAIAVSRDQLNQHRADACEEGAGCPACFQEDDPMLIATCRANRCELVNLLERDDVTSCVEGIDCRVRPAQCCECVSGDVPLIAIRTGADPVFESLVCDASQACDACVPVFDKFPECVSGRCAVSSFTRGAP